MKGLYSKFHFFEHAFGTTYYVVDKQNSHMMGIFDDKLEDIDCDAQMKPFNLAQLSQMIATLEQRKQGFNDSSVSDNTNAPNNKITVPQYTKRVQIFWFF